MMQKRSPRTSSVLVSWALGLGLVATALPSGAEPPSEGSRGKGDRPAAARDSSKVFGLTRLHEFHLEFSAAQWAKMQPAGSGGFPGPRGFGGGPPGPQGPPAQGAAKRTDAHRGSGFGVEFPWAHATFAAEGKTIKDVGVRYKGNASYMASAGGLKRNLKIALDHYQKGQRFQGLKKLNLNAGAMDPTRVREALSYAVFRAAGVPAPRTAFARVTLTVPGKYDRELLGLYTVVEQVDRTFLKDHFKNSGGLLMKPERLRGPDYLGEDWDRYEGQYQPKSKPTREQARRVIAFARLVNRADDARFQKEIGSYLDIDEFLRFVAANTLLVNLDSLFTMGHNYYLYLNPETNKFVYIPWDLDLSLAGFPMSGPPERQVELSLTHPYAGENKLLDRLLAIKEVREKYQKVLRELSKTCFTRARLLEEVAAIEKVVKEPLAREKKAAQARKEGRGGFGFGPPMGGPFGGGALAPRAFVEKRTASVAAQLAGKGKGYVPQGGFGPGGPGGPPGPFGLGNMLARPLLEALDTDKDGKVSKEELVAGAKRFFRDCDRAGKGKIDQKAIADRLNRLLPGPGGFGPRGGGPFGPPRGPEGFGPGTVLAAAIVKRADVDRDGKVTLKEFLAGAEALFKGADPAGKGKLDEKALAGALNKLLPAPRFGPPPPPNGLPGPGPFGPPPREGRE